MNLNDLSTQLLYTTAPIWVERADGTTTSATAFIYNFPVQKESGQFIPFLVTNFHVVKDAKRGLIELVQSESEKPSPSKRIRAELSAELLLMYNNPSLDLAAIPLGPLLNQLAGAGNTPFFRALGPELIPAPEALDELGAMEEVVFIGYPSGLRDEHNATPLLRRGITATPVWNDFGGQPRFLIDAGVFPGSSGSPVFIFNSGAYGARQGFVVGNRLLFLGIVAESMVRTEVSSNAYLGIGLVIKSAAVREFIGNAAATLQRQGSLT